MSGEFSTVSLPEREPELALQSEVKGICQARHSELCAGQPLAVRDKLLCFQEAHGSSQVSLTRNAGFFRVLAGGESCLKRSGLATAPRASRNREATLSCGQVLLLSLWSLRSFYSSVAGGPSDAGARVHDTNFRKNLPLAAHLIPQNVPKSHCTWVTQLSPGQLGKSVVRKGPGVSILEFSCNARDRHPHRVI